VERNRPAPSVPPSSNTHGDTHCYSMHPREAFCLGKKIVARAARTLLNHSVIRIHEVARLLSPCTKPPVIPKGSTTGQSLSSTDRNFLSTGLTRHVQECGSLWQGLLATGHQGEGLPALAVASGFVVPVHASELERTGQNKVICSI
jgi:hypothetical protein